MTEPFYRVTVERVTIDTSEKYDRETKQTIYTQEVGANEFELKHLITAINFPTHVYMGEDKPQVTYGVDMGMSEPEASDEVEA